MATSAAHLFNLIGLLAAALSALTFFPQVLHTWQKRTAAGLSGSMLAVGAAGMALWLAYGAYFHNTPILVGNAFNLLFTLTLVYFKWRFRNTY
ncbi:SemiSWEET family sugar transporter [Hymenobacter caeli]|uniref:MtN3 and saliva related transmembrane protein n=1 Tax=Hymenobacter caeli TaxID=2735894 RepID=A0ABX2FV89_9BACT|nr:PQ-loop domain-containing transporter [Hymenobacter caeli]NRT21106.1 MtN3 and saliva related transmembrane protein [Hymenobacter caeli]